ncbi:MAG: FAD-dependent oxidoreductase, partial [Nocardioidaceae bacterium]|nr:FAD-dependent oxidoreductase [Nocardioidaceae bacterium]
MARVIVVGGGLGGMAAAARLAKAGHEVALLEAADHLGGALACVAQDGYTWDGGPINTLLPAAVRDLFRKTGRPLEKEIDGDLIPASVLHEHRFADGTSLSLPGGSRAAQVSAFDQLGSGLGEKWARHVDIYAEVWDILRRHYVEAPWTSTDRASVPK